MTIDGSKVRQFLDERDWTHKRLAKELGCSHRTVGNILAGIMPVGETLIKLAKLMGCSVEELIPSEAMKAS